MNRYYPIKKVGEKETEQNAWDEIKEQKEVLMAGVSVPGGQQLNQGFRSNSREGNRCSMGMSREPDSISIS